MRKFGLGLGALLLATALAVAGCGEAEGGTPTIRVAEIPWEHEWVPAYIMKHAFEEMGYPVEMVEGDIGFMFMSVANGDVDVYPDVWLPTLHEGYMEEHGDDIELTGTIYEEADIGWAVPEYVDEIDSIEDLHEHGDLVGGRIAGVEPGAGMMQTSEKTLEVYDLDLELVEGSTASMLGEVDSAIRNEEPVLFLAWRPHTMFTQYDIKLLDDPEGVWALDDSITGVWPELKERAPDVYAFTEHFAMEIAEVEEVLWWMEDEDLTVEEATARWIEENRDYIDGIYDEIGAEI